MEYFDTSWYGKKCPGTQTIVNEDVDCTGGHDTKKIGLWNHLEIRENIWCERWLWGYVLRNYLSISFLILCLNNVLMFIFSPMYSIKIGPSCHSSDFKSYLIMERNITLFLYSEWSHNVFYCYNEIAILRQPAPNQACK